MIHLDWLTSRLLDKIGPMLGVRLGRAHYYQTIIVPLAVSEWLDRQAATNPAVAEVIERYRREMRRTTDASRRMAAERRQRRYADRRSARLSEPVDNHRVTGQLQDHRGASSNWADQTATLLDLARSGRRHDFISLVIMLGINSPDRGPQWSTPEEFYAATRQKLGLPDTQTP